MAQPQHPAIAAFEVEAGVLHVGGIPLPRLADRVGSTPFFAYDRRLLTERVAQLRQSLPADVHLSYAIKANPMPAIVQHLARLVDGFDVASGFEMKTALDTEMNAEHVSFAGPGKTCEELSRAVAAGVVIHIESERELRTIAGLAREQEMRPPVALRVNPDFELKASGMRMGGGPQQFGIDAERVLAILSDVALADVDFRGFHIFAGSQNLSADNIKITQEQIVDLVLKLADHTPAPIRHVNIGGGFGIPYFPKDKPLDLKVTGSYLAGIIPRLRAKLPEARVIVELGRYIVGECGIYVSRIVDRKDSRGTTFLVTDGGLNHQLAASGNFGQVIRRNYPVAIGNRVTNPEEETVTVVGCLCTPLDLLADKIALPRADVGDLFVVFQSGAYGMSASPTAFLGHPPPVEVLV
jgi:diaminopimelate decarboxylase